MLGRGGGGVRVRRWGAVLAVVGVVGAAFVVGTGSAGAASVSPTTTADGGAGSGSLRDVLQNGVSAGDTVVLQAGATYVLDAAGPCGQIDIATAVTIEGNDATVTQSCPNTRIFNVTADLTVRHLTLSGANSGGNSGAALRLDGGSTWSLDHVTVTDNHSNNDCDCVNSK